MNRAERAPAETEDQLRRQRQSEDDLAGVTDCTVVNTYLAAWDACAFVPPDIKAVLASLMTAIATTKPTQADIARRDPDELHAWHAAIVAGAKHVPLGSLPRLGIAETMLELALGDRF